MHSQWCFYLFARMYVVSWHIVFFFYGGVRKQMQYTVNNLYTEINQMLDMSILSTVTVNCGKKKINIKKLFTYFITC